MRSAVDLQLRGKIFELEAADTLRELPGLSGHFTTNIVKSPHLREYRCSVSALVCA